ncbi:MAG: aminomuconate-semialdehyde/2-hydroxymuconate-6-semialdehyde dehydrogenase [Mariniblastus sp.]|jgi:aminomuconate-semialdehyde/2-hydroxymuconate-6-semialdehyde dehydrogenase
MSDDILNFINGKYVAPQSDDWIDNINPADGSTTGRIANSNAADVDAAVSAAEKALESWSNSTLEFRSSIMMKIADLIDQNLESLAVAESEDSGKPITRARTIEIPRAASNFRFFASAITQFASESHESVGLNAINFTLRQPLGVVGCISPWNLPLYLFTWKIAPAIATGNCVVAKPSELTPRTASLLGELCNQAGLPAGVLNIVQGNGGSAGQAMLEHRGIKAISFTGGTATGEHVARTVAPQFKKLSLELGGKNPNIIFADCNYDKALATTVLSSFANQGQICLCGSRIFIEAPLYEQFKHDLVTKTQSLIVGHPAQPETQIGAMISKSHHEKVLGYFDVAQQEGANLLCGGTVAEVPGAENGFYLQPTIFEVDSNLGRISQEEIFGPVVTIMPFETELELIELANDVRYGLSATIWTTDLDRTMRLSKKIESGVIWVNTWLMRDLRTPFGGMKNSGVGREGGLEALRFFTEPKNICIVYE